MEPIATSVAARGHAVHVVAPWHPEWRRPSQGALRFHLFRYAPVASLNVFGYAAALRADVSLRASAIAVAPLAMIAGTYSVWRVARDTRATIVHAHWVLPSGVMGAFSAGSRSLVISLHGSDVFVAERHQMAKWAARAAFARAAWVTACSEDLRRRAVALGANADRTSVVPYGVDSERFGSSPGARRQGRSMLGLADDAPVVLAFGRLVRKKGFEYLLDAATVLREKYPSLQVVIAGEGDLAGALRTQASASGMAQQVRWLGAVSQDTIPTLLAAADVAVVPSIHDAAGNVDGLPNTVLEIMASGTALVATPVGGIAAVATDGETARVVPERDSAALAGAIETLLRQPSLRHELGRRARELVSRDYSWKGMAAKFEAIYDEVRPPSSAVKDSHSS
jgi:glycosyltransferase involved in cell wall biosynthesis